MNNINKVLLSLVNSSKHNICNNGHEDSVCSVCDKTIYYIFCSNCPLCNRDNSTTIIKAIDEIRIKYNE